MDKTIKRKLEHIEICLDRDVQSDLSSEFGKLRFKRSGGAGLNSQKTDISTVFFGKMFKAPILIEAMTGGALGTEKLNRNLAGAAQKLGIGMGVGSQRAALENADLEYSYYVRDVAPDIFLLANIGISQVMFYPIEKIAYLVRMIDADGLAVHFNLRQEIVQPEGARQFKGAYGALGKLCAKVKFPVIAKEVGFGISAEMAKRLEGLGVAAIDVAGVGGTDWLKVEHYRGSGIDGKYFKPGIATAECLKQCLNAVKIPVIASGGIRTGLDIAKSLALGAVLAGIALPLLRPATVSSNEVIKKLKGYILELKKIMADLGAKNIEELRKVGFA